MEQCEYQLKQTQCQVFTLTRLNDLQIQQQHHTSDSNIQNKKQNYGRWTYDQQLLYINFAQINSINLVSKKNRRSSKVFRKMSEMIPSRSADQCRSHHQKMQRKHGSIWSIICYCKKTLQKLISKQKRLQQVNYAINPIIIDQQINSEFEQQYLNFISTPTTLNSYKFQDIDQYFPSEQIIQENYFNLSDSLNFNVNKYEYDWLS